MRLKYRQSSTYACPNSPNDLNGPKDPNSPNGPNDLNLRQQDKTTAETHGPMRLRS
jgi:hypothetical protein